jgi:basic membrane protein A
MKKLISLISALTLVLTVSTACGSKTPVTPAVETPVAETPVEGTTPVETKTEGIFDAIAKEEIKVGVIHIGNPADGSGYTFAHDQGIVGMQKELGLEDSQIIRKNNVNDTDPTATETAIRECIEEGANIIFGTSWGYMDTMEALAEEYPEVIFSHGTGYKSNGSNLNNYFGRIYQARYLSGIVAGLKTESNIVGYVAAMGIDNSEVTGGINAFAMGVNSVNPQLEAEKANAFGIGYNSDMSKDAPKATLTSAVWDWSAYYTFAVESLINGTWSGENYYGGMKEGLVDIAPLSEALVADGTKEAVELAKAAILDGTLNVFDGVIETNDGKTVGEAGKTLDDATITGGINWYFKNVVLK